MPIVFPSSARRGLHVIPAAVLATLCGLHVRGDDPPADTVAVERGRFEVALELEGEFEPIDAAVVEFTSDSWTQPLAILRLARHGTMLDAGDEIVAFDPEKLERALAESRIELALGEKTLDIARRELPITEALHPLDVAKAERDGRIAAEDKARYVAVERKLQEESARFGLKSAEERLKYSREELKQLEAMYRDKDLTEETEEMILQRTRFEVEQAEFFLRQQRVRAEETLEIELPRQDVTVEETAERARLELEKARATLPLAIEQKRLALAKAEHDRAVALRKFADLEEDRGRLTLTAPRSGILYYGRQGDAGWNTAAVAAKAVVGEKVPPGELAFTVVDPARIRFRAKVAEKQLHLLRDGLTGRVEPAGYPDVAAAVTLEPFTAVPKEGAYTARFAVVPPAGGPRIVPGMTGTARVVVVSKPDALTLPEKAVFRQADGARVVHVVAADGGVATKPVKTGLVHGDRIEILGGVAAGDRVRTTAP